MSDAPWLDLHFRTARAEYEEALRFVGIESGWTVLDAACGSGGYTRCCPNLSVPRAGLPPLIWRRRTLPRSSASFKKDIVQRRWQAAARFMEAFPGMTVTKAIGATPGDPGFLSRYAQGLRDAGLPE
jgi:hypothetical protein